MSDTTPLLVQFPNSGHLGLTRYRRCRQAAQRALSSKFKHWFVLTLVVLDVAGILADICIALITCELDRENEPWVHPTRESLKVLALTLSSLFLVELLLELWAHGPRRYLSNKITCFDAFVIVISFVVDVAEHGGVAEEVASLVVILRLWRFVKIADEFGVEASERWDEMEERVAALEKENSDLREELRRSNKAQPADEEQGIPDEGIEEEQ
ncbi:hypothetical protein PFICI_13138 [Pestalotiopsis fici W106-1]|uniref:Voltage-gated hydrogen channel 1 n=1 Tax=Pestalotiopsis fici (strain W106-1 / CGMCC3.15140) TaxID=1229662 RepID=W3WLK3_PESFW|nr:uncharacterized protein PFICI_13138 [Pestalotiopsis fici W106-1]ETS74654.1 hypothetical protein PFICI_13138 [Pestalotiopsis fici W106-1]